MNEKRPTKKLLAALLLILILPALLLMGVSCGGQRRMAQEPPEPTSGEQARQTVTNFLEMCVQGRVQEAIAKYVRPPESPEEGPMSTEYLLVLGNTVGFTVASSSIALPLPNDFPYEKENDAPSHLGVNVDIQYKDGTSVGPGFVCDANGEYIIQVDFPLK